MYELDRNALYLFNLGESAYAYRALGAHAENGGVRFAVWAPNARAVSVTGDFNGWSREADNMTPVGSTGVWTTHVPNARMGQYYKYAVTAQTGETLMKADPFALRADMRPANASKLHFPLDFAWSDNEYMEKRRVPFAKPMNVYEVHAGSWRAGRTLYDLSHELVDYAADMGYTHIELMPVTEFPFDGSWGYQATGYFAVSARYGTPEDLKLFVDRAHSRGLGVLLDWVPAHFALDEHGLYRFDGTPLYEHADSRRGFQPQWGTAVFDFGKGEVQSFLISSAVYWLKEYHIDGLRADAVSSMLYLDYGRNGDEWTPNIKGGHENLEAVEFLQKLARAVGRECPGAMLIAEESSAWPLVTKPPEAGGLGFHFKWNMGWMNDTLSYFSLKSEHRPYHHDKLTFPMVYAFAENHILPLSHDEVVHGKRSLIGRMDGEYDDRFLQLRQLYMYQFACPGKKLNFMGSELAQFTEWAYQKELDWLLLDYPQHRAMREFCRALNRFYKESPELWERDGGWDGFRWVAVNDAQNSVLSFLRRSSRGDLLCVFNFSGENRAAYPVVLPKARITPVFVSGADFPIIEGEDVTLDLPRFSAGYFKVEYLGVKANEA